MRANRGHRTFFARVWFAKRGGENAFAGDVQTMEAQMHQILLTNNETAIRAFPGKSIPVEGDSRAVLRAVRDRVHTGWKLLTHPLAASIKMLHSPVVSVLMEEGTGAPDAESLARIESDILTLDTVLGQRDFDHRNKDAYQFVDWNRMQSALNELNRQKG